MSANLRLPIFGSTPPDSPSGHALPHPENGAPHENGAHEHDEGADDAELMQVGDLAKEAGKTVRAIHLYEELNLLKPAARSKGRYRLYSRDALTRIRWIGKLQDMGFSLTDIQ